MSGGCLESVWRLSWKCLYGCLVSDWKVFGRGSLVRFIYRNSMVRTGWIKTGLVSSCLDMSGRNILGQKCLDLKFLGSKIFWVTKKFIEPKFFGLGIILESKYFWTQILCLIIYWLQNLAQLKSRVWHSQPSLSSLLRISYLKDNTTLTIHQYCPKHKTD